jgi:hypothetical protein
LDNFLDSAPASISQAINWNISKNALKCNLTENLACKL